MTERFERACRWILVATLTAMVTGCANLVPVKTFSGETKKVSAAYEPLKVTAFEACVDQRTTRPLIMMRQPIDAAGFRTTAETECATDSPVDDIAALLDAYADALASLADAKLPNYKEQFSKLGAVVETLKSGDTPYVPKSQADA